jgi:hypothetical protein
MAKMPDLAPSRLSRQQRRRLTQVLDKLVRRDTCSVCSTPLVHNSRTVYGLNSRGEAVLAGECCFNQVAIILGHGLFSKRKYDFLNWCRCEPGDSPARRLEANGQIDEAMALYQKAIAAADKQFEGIERWHGGADFSGVERSLLDHPWKTDDRAWFEGNPKRSHRVRMPFTDEFETKVPAGCALIILVRQVKPGTRVRHGFYLNADMVPVPDNEAIAHALFEVASGREPMPRNGWALNALITKYANRGSC